MFCSFLRIKSFNGFLCFFDRKMNYVRLIKICFIYNSDITVFIAHFGLRFVRNLIILHIGYRHFFNLF